MAGEIIPSGTLAEALTPLLYGGDLMPDQDGQSTPQSWAQRRNAA